MRDDDAGVSPVIGTILMVAITVVIAAVVFVLATSFGDRTERAPQVAFTEDATARSIQVLRVEPATQWLRDLDIGGECADSATLNGVAWPPPGGTVVRPGDTIAGCVAGDDLKVIATQPNILVYEVVFD